MRMINIKTTWVLGISTPLRSSEPLPIRWHTLGQGVFGMQQKVQSFLKVQSSKTSPYFCLQLSAPAVALAETLSLRLLPLDLTSPDVTQVPPPQQRQPHPLVSWGTDYIKIIQVNTEAFNTWWSGPQLMISSLKEGIVAEYLVTVPQVLQIWNRECFSRKLERPKWLSFRSLYWVYHHLAHVQANLGQNASQCHWEGNTIIRRGCAWGGKGVFKTRFVNYKVGTVSPAGNNENNI